MALALPPSADMNHETGAASPNAAQSGSARIVIIDGSNVAHCSEGEAARLENIELVMRRLAEQGYEPVVLADAALRHQIDRPEEFEQLVEAGTIRQAPAGTDADYFILAFARELGAGVVSNDRFRERLDAFPEARDLIIRYMIVNGEVIFERRHRRRSR
jgi:hypothetical protein